MIPTHQDLHTALKSPREEDRHDALRALRSLDLKESGAFLFYAMGDESWRVRKEAVDVFVSSAPDDSQIDMLLELLRTWDNAGLRNSAAEAAVRLGTKATSSLIHMVHDPDSDVRKFVIDVMGAIGTNDFVPTLLDALADPDVNVAAAAAEHLGSIGCTSAVPRLIAAIVENEAPFFRFNALAALGKLAAPAPVPEAITRLAGQDILRKAVYECLGSIGDHTVAPLLLEGFGIRQKSSRGAAARAFYRILERSAGQRRNQLEDLLHGLGGSDTVACLAELATSEDTAIAEATTVLLGIINDSSAVPALMKAYANERLSALAVKALRGMGPRALERLTGSFADAGDMERGLICGLIGELGYRTASATVTGALADQSPAVRRAAVTAAGKLGLAEIVPGIVKLLDDPDHDVRDAAVTSLQLLALVDRPAVQDVARKLSDSDQPAQRRDASILLIAIGDGERLTLLTKDEDPGVRQAAVTGLGTLCPPAAGRALQIALVDEDPEVRVSAAAALGNLGTPESLSHLRLALNDDDPWVRCAALKSIVRIAPDEMLASISSLLSDPVDLVVLTCLELLDTAGTREASALAARLTDSPDREIAALAATIAARHTEQGA